MDYILVIAKLFHIENTSLFLKLDKNDFLKGLIVAVLSLPVSTAYSIFEGWLTTDHFVTPNWHDLMKVVVISVVTYLSKNLFQKPSATTLVVNK